MLLDKARKAHHSKISQEFPEPALSKPSQFLTPTRLTIDFLKELRKRAAQEIDESKILDPFEELAVEWVITVPAIWSEQAKDLTIFCAQKAGLGTPKIITEPEAAMIHVLQNLQSTGALEIGNAYTVCDAGGGTVDLITYKITSIEPLRVEELTEGDGDRCGGVYVTRQFRNYIVKNYAELHFWTEEHTTAAVEAFESNVKRKFDDRDEIVVVKVPRVNDYNKGTIRIHKHKVFIPSADIRAMFSKVCSPIAQLIKEQYYRAKRKDTSVTAVVLVGGFSESPYLQQYLEREIATVDKATKVIKPDNGWSAIVRGALSRALPILTSKQHFPQVTSRIARRYFGITSSRPVQAKDPDNKK